MKKFKLSLKNKALLWIIIVLLPILITFFIVYNQNRTYLKQRIRNKLSLDKTINTISILSLEGRVAASTNSAEIGRDFSSETIFVKGKETVTMVEKCFGHCKLTEIAISAPILNKDTGRLIGVIVNYIPIAKPV